MRAANLVVTSSLVSVAELRDVYTPMPVETAKEIDEPHRDQVPPVFNM